MNAVFFEEHGGPEVLKYGDFREPSVGLNDVLVEIKACALNHLDIWVRQGLPGISVPLPHIPGSDVCGVILEMGRAAKKFKKGERVIIAPGQLPVLSALLYQGKDSYSPESQVLGLQTNGGYAEKIAVNERDRKSVV